MAGSAATFTAQVQRIHDGGDHRIFVAQLLHPRWREEAPLLFWGGSFGEFQPRQAAPNDFLPPVADGSVRLRLRIPGSGRRLAAPRIDPALLARHACRHAACDFRASPRGLPLQGRKGNGALVPEDAETRDAGSTVSATLQSTTE